MCMCIDACVRMWSLLIFQGTMVHRHLSVGNRHSSAGHRHLSVGNRHSSAGPGHLSFGHYHSSGGLHHSSVCQCHLSVNHCHVSVGHRRATKWLTFKSLWPFWLKYLFWLKPFRQSQHGILEKMQAWCSPLPRFKHQTNRSCAGSATLTFYIVFIGLHIWRI